MPKISGRPETRRKLKLEDAIVASFLMEHEERYWRKVCVVEGCDHRMGPDTTKPGWVTSWKSCHERQLPAFVAREDDPEYNRQGIACPCCVQKILERE